MLLALTPRRHLVEERWARIVRVAAAFIEAGS
jgi:hypothetical protein